MVVVDTSVLVALFKGLQNPAVECLRRLELDETPIAIPAVCCQEVLQGARDRREWKLLLENLSTQRSLVPSDVLASHIEAARIYFDCRRKGITIRSAVDCLIAHLVLERDWVLLHDDEDFERIRKVRPLRTLRS